MKTFLTEKHNIPEGATHYLEATDSHKFAWWNSRENTLLCPENSGEWQPALISDDVYNPTPIPQTNIETPEEKEALDTMTGISREHLMSMINLQTETIKELSEELNSSESPNGSSDIVKPLWAKWSIGDAVTKTKGSPWAGKVVGYYQTDLTSKGYAVESSTEKGSVQIYPEAALCSVETEAGRVERERLEAAYDLYCEWCVAMRYPKFSFEQFTTCARDKAGMLAVVDKTNYRKESD